LSRNIRTASGFRLSLSARHEWGESWREGKYNKYVDFLATQNRLQTAIFDKRLLSPALSSLVPREERE
jgi:hypothetical protein